VTDLNYEGVSLKNVPYFQKNRFWVSPMNYLPETFDTSQVQPKIQFMTYRSGTVNRPRMWFSPPKNGLLSPRP
jgi:hypothetical protein